MQDDAWVVSLARSAQNQTLYGPDHRVTRAAVEQAWNALSAALNEREAVELALDGSTLIVDGNPLEKLHPTVAALRDRLTRQGVEDLRFDRTCQPESLHGFLQVLNVQPDAAEAGASFRTRLAAAHAPGITVSQSVYRKVSENARIVEKATSADGVESEVADFLQSFQAGAKPAATAEMPPPPPAARPAAEVLPPPPAGVERVDAAGIPKEPESAAADPATRDMADFLSGKPRPAGLGDGFARAAKGRERDVGELVALFIAAVMMKKNRGGMSGEDFAESITQSLGRTIEALRETGGTTEPTARALQMFSRQVEPWMQETLGAETPGAARSARAMLDDAAATTRARSVLETYHKRNEQLERWKTKVEKTLSDLGPARLEALGLGEAFREAGFMSAATAGPSPEGIAAELTAGAEDAPGGTPPRDLALQALLTSWTAGAHPSGPGGIAAEDFKQDLAQIRREVNTLIDSTARKIESLVDQVERWKRAPAPAVPDLRRSVRIMAEAVQEISQPLSVIRASLEMLDPARADRMDPRQRQETLGLATESATRLQSLVAKIGGIAGLPDSLKPDRAALD